MNYHQCLPFGSGSDALSVASPLASETTRCTEMKISRSGQSFNGRAIRSLGKIVRSPSLAIPHLTVQNIGEIDFAKLKALGIKGIIFDKDNTLTAPYVDEIHPLLKDSLNQCSIHFGKNICIMSNSAGTLDDKNFVSALNIEAKLGIPVLRHREKKPGGLNEVLQYFNETCGENVSPKDLCVIGDRLLTDILFGNLHGMLTIHTKPLTLEGDNVMASIARRLETYIFCNSMYAFRASDHEMSMQLNSCILRDS